MRNLVIATVMGLVVTSGLCARPFGRGGGIMKRGEMNRPPMEEMHSEEGPEECHEECGVDSKRKRPPMRRMRPVFKANGFAVDGERYEIFGITILPPKPVKRDFDKTDEDVSEDTPENMEEVLERVDRGILGLGTVRYVLKDIDMEFEELKHEGEEDEVDEGEEELAKIHGRKVISSIKATLYHAPEMRKLDEEELVDEDGDEEEEAEEEVAEEETEEAVGTVSIWIEMKEFGRRHVPVVRGELTCDSGSYNLFAKLQHGPRPRVMRHDHEEEEVELLSEEETEEVVDEENIDEEADK